MNVILKWYCTNTTASHNKHYFVAIVEDRSQLKVLTAWGRIGNTLGMKEQHCSFRMEADALAKKVIDERTGKGYTVKQMDRLSGAEIQEYRRLKAPDWFLKSGTFTPPPSSAGVPASKTAVGSHLLAAIEAEKQRKRAPRKPKPEPKAKLRRTKAEWNF